MEAKKEETTPTRLTIDFASQENTIKSIVTAGEDLVALLGLETEDLALAKIKLSKTEADVERQIRNNALVKVTEGYVSSAVSANTDVVALRERVARMEGKVAGIRASLDNVDRGYGLFKTWMLCQRPIGLQDR